MPVIGWILLSLLILLLAALILPLRVRIEYLDTWHGTVFLFGIIPVFSFPVSKKKPPKPAESASSSQTTPAEVPTKTKPSVTDEIKALYREEGVGGVLSFFKQLLLLTKGTLSRLARFITVRRLALCVRIGGEEAEDIALTYGKVNAAFFSALSALSLMLRIRRPSVLIQPDFTAQNSTAKLRMLVWVWPFGVLFELIRALCRLIAVWMKTVKKPLGGSDPISAVQKPLS